MSVNLNLEQPKVTTDSERAVRPDETVENARRGAAAIGVQLDADVISVDDFFFVSQLRCAYQHAFPPFARDVRIAGKGPSRSQCLASCFMEFIERVSLYRYAAQIDREHACLDLRDQKLYRMARVSDINNTMCVAAGNTWEEAILHALHELIETRIAGACYFAPYKVVSFDLLCTDWPRWVKENFLIIRSPSPLPRFHHVTALQYPHDGQMDAHLAHKAVKADGRLFLSGNPRTRRVSDHSPDSGGAAGLSLETCVHRAIGEVFQGTLGVRGSRRRLETPPHIPQVAADEMIDYDTPSVTGDIRCILEQLGEDVFVGVVDVTDPDIGIPVVKLISDYDPRHSLVSSTVLDLFYRSDMP